MKAASVVEPQLEEVGDDEPGCLACVCNPTMTFCGRYDEEWDEDTTPATDEDICPECLAGSCLKCGCRDGNPCARCAGED